MKKTLSMLLAVVMVLSIVAVGIPSYAADRVVQNTGKHTLSENNVGIDVPHFSGSVYYNKVTGKTPSNLKYDDPTGVGDLISDKANPTDSRITLDGKISEEEWGTPLLDLSSEYAARKGISTTPSAENTYYHWNGNDGDNRLNLSAGLKFKVWMAWDEEYLLVAAQIIDPDGTKLAEGGENVWDGDVLQMRFDPEGPNSISAAAGKDYDPATYRFPFNSSDLRDGHPVETYGGLVPNLGVGYLDTAGKIEVQDMSMRYFPYENEIKDAEGNLDRIETTWRQCNSYWEDDFVNGDNPFGVTIASFNTVAEAQPDNARAFKSGFEIAIPWHYMDGSYVKYDKEAQTIETILADYVPQAGDEFGAVIALLNAGRGGKGFNSWLSWGSGLCASQVTSADYPTAGGSNSMLLVADELGTTGCNHTFSEPDCTHPYVCTKCGYEKGFCTGHNYSHVVNSYATAASNGEIVSTCSVCGDVHTQVIPAEAKNVMHVFNGVVRDTDWDDSGYPYLYVEEDADGNDTTIPIMDPRTGQQMDIIEEYNGRTVLDLSNDRPGTYFTNKTDLNSYSYKYDFRICTAEENGFRESKINESYRDGWYHWFGGADPAPEGYRYGMKYAAGFFPSEHFSTKGKFMIVENGYTTKNKAGEFDGKVLAETAEIDLGTDWHNINFIFDESTNTAILLCDGEIMCGAWDEGFNMDGNANRAFVRRFHVSCMITDMALGNKTAFFDVAEPTGYTVTCDGEVIGTFEEGETVELPVPEFADGYRFFTWEGADVERSEFSSRNTTANKRTYTLVMPANDVELTSKSVLVGDVNGDKKITIRDLATMAKILAGSLEVDELKSEAADLNLDGRIRLNDSTFVKRLLADSYAIEK